MEKEIKFSLSMKVGIRTVNAYLKKYKGYRLVRAEVNGNSVDSLVKKGYEAIVTKNNYQSLYLTDKKEEALKPALDEGVVFEEKMV